MGAPAGVKIMLGDGEAWLPVIPGWGLHDYGTLVSTSPAHTLRGWDGRVCANPRFEDCRTVALPSNPAIRITRTQVVGGELWFKLEFGIGVACEGPAQPGRDVLSGWIPGFGSNSRREQHAQPGRDVLSGWIPGFGSRRERQAAVDGVDGSRRDVLRDDSRKDAVTLAVSFSRS